MEPFRLNIPVLESICEGLVQDIANYSRMSEEIKQCCEVLTSTSWEGKARDQFVKNSQRWYDESQAFIEDLTSFHRTLSVKVLPKAKELNEIALRLPELLAAQGASAGDKNILSYNSDSHETIEYCYRRLMEEYDNSLATLLGARNTAASLEYSKGVGSRLAGEIRACMEEMEDRKGKLLSLQSELRYYGDEIRCLEETVIADMSVYEMPDGWTREMVEMQRQFGEFGAFVTIEDGQPRYNWSQIKRYLDRNWDSLTKEEQRLLLKELEKALEGKEIDGIDDLRQRLELAVLEEKGYITIQDGTIIYEVEYLAKHLEDENLSQKELEELQADLEFLFGEEWNLAEHVGLTTNQLNTVEVIQLELYLRIHKQELKEDFELKTEAEYESFKRDSHIMLLFWQTEYREKYEVMAAMTQEERLEAFESRQSNPQDDMLFLSQLKSFSYEERAAILTILNRDYQISAEQLKEIRGEKYRGEDLGARGIEVTYRCSRGGKSFAEFMAEGYQQWGSQVSVGLNLTLAPLAFEGAWLKANPPESNKSLNPEISRLDKMEVESQNSFKTSAYLGLGEASIKEIDVRYGTDQRLGQLPTDLKNNKFVHTDPNATAIEVEVGELMWENGVYLEGKTPVGPRGPGTADYNNLSTGGTAELKTLPGSSSNNVVREITKAQSDNVIVVLEQGQLTAEEMQKLSGRIFGPNAPGTPKNNVQIIYSTPEGLQIGEVLERIVD